MPVYIATLTGRHARPSEDALAALRADLRGSALTPSDPGYGRVREPFNAMHPRRPALVVRCAATADVAHAVTFARRAGSESFAGRGSLVTSVLGGGYSVDGLSAVDDGLLIDLSGLTAVEVDPVRRLARVQGGALWRDVDRETQDRGLAAPGGMVSGTGVAGLTLDGGHGWLRRKHGLACDSLVAAEIVCADGEVREASAESNPDLYWALRGGGGNFGVVTSLTFRLSPVGPEVAFARTFYPIDEVADVLRAWRAAVAEAPDDVTSMCAAFTVPAQPQFPAAVHGRPVAMVAAVHAGDPEQGMSRLQTLRELGDPLADLSRPMPFTAVQSAFDTLFPRQRLQAYWRSGHLPGLGDEAIAVIASAARDRPAPPTMVNTFHMGGAIARVGAGETACNGRTAPFAVSIDGMWTDPSRNAEHVAWVRSAWKELGAAAAAGAHSDGAPSANHLRLAEVKATYDPDNFFRLNRNIAPAR